ncbi:MAG TPA: 2-dehydro-3-deoxygalactonokinase [Devosia sp.]|nr:2-dehydro-3-deoxygalactonokinase [Devosia sp.]
MHIAIQWTSAAFHAWLLGTEGTVAAEHQSAHGVNSVGDGGFADALRAEIGPWLPDAQAILLSGMVTSRTGWAESPFIMVPAALPDLLTQAVRQDCAGLPPLYFLPGIARDNPVPDMMRGEEMAIFGAEDRLPDVVILPGTHTKWVKTDGTSITDIATYMGGEVLNLLKQDSLVSRLIPPGYVPHPEAFERGVLIAQDKTALPGGVLQRIFSARSLVLFNRLKPEEITDYLTGLMLGSEIAEAFANMERPSDIHVLGNGPMAIAYQRALALFGTAAPTLVSAPAKAFANLAAALASSP